MTAMSQTERAELCDLAERVGPDAPTLCEGWQVKDLLAHLVLREGSPAAVGFVVPPLSGLAERGIARLRRSDFTELVGRLRSGPPRFSPLAIPAVERLVNSVELFVHHEDIRRAAAQWEPRVLAPQAQQVLWKTTGFMGKRLVKSAPVGVVAERSDTGERAVLRAGGREVVVRGLPGEITLFLFGREDQARVELVGDPEDVAALRGTDRSL